MRLLDLETTLSVFLDSDPRVDSAAARLNVHPNTLRHRLKRYDEVSGLRPTRVEDTILMKEAKDE
jgi:DNA-binding PucR family transcriptional regulator